MRYLTLALAVTASPAFAHHEVVMVSSMLPMITGLAAIAAASFVAWWPRK